METKFTTKFEIIVLIICVLYLSLPFTDAFNIGVRWTACSLDPNENNNPCGSLYDAVCDGAHCKCPSGTHEDKTLKKCSTGGGPQGGDDLDLPLDYVPGKKPESKPKTPMQPSQPSAPAQPNIPPAKPQAPVEDSQIAKKTGGGIGGGIGLLVLLGLFYFCCCRGEKGKSLRSKLPFFKKSGEGQQQQQQPPGANYQMQQPVPDQQPWKPPPAAV